MRRITPPLPSVSGAHRLRAARAKLIELLQTAVKRGELRTGLDIDLAMDLLFGPDHVSPLHAAVGSGRSAESRCRFFLAAQCSARKAHEPKSASQWEINFALKMDIADVRPDANLFSTRNPALTPGIHSLRPGDTCENQR